MRNPETGRFEKNADGKVIKPPGWKPPNVEAELARQVNEGSWGLEMPCTPSKKKSQMPVQETPSKEVQEEESTQEVLFQRHKKWHKSKHQKRHKCLERSEMAQVDF